MRTSGLSEALRDLFEGPLSELLSELKNHHEMISVLQPMSRQWSFTDPVTGFAFQVQRTQLPLMPESACPLYSLQGATCDPGLLAHFIMPKRADEDIRWLIVYVIVYYLQ